ncbi:MAG TPA: hypothetical protein VNU45_02815 [Rummeliibacillus sp.]|nr:hypothetical protein [Rummeliibacillus sp.]
MKLEKREVQSLLKSQVEEHKTTVKFEDVWSAYKQHNVTKSKYSITKMGLVTCCILFLIATPVGASVFMKWHNVEIEDIDAKTLTQIQADTTPRLNFEAYPDYLNTFAKVNLEESEKIAPFEILRPLHFSIPLEISTGVLNERSGDTETREFNAYWDLFHEGEQWAFVRQSLDERSHQMLNEDEIRVKFKLLPNDRVISLQEKDAVAILSDLGEDGKMITMVVKNINDQVIDFEIRGNIGREKLITLAKSYLHN